MDCWKTPIPTNLADKYCQGNKFAASVLRELLCRARNTDGTIYHHGEPIILKKGQCVCGRIELAGCFGLSKNQSGKVQRILSFLEKSANQIDKQKSRNCSIITITNYCEITSFEQSNKQSIDNQQSNNRQSIDTNKSDKKLKNEIIRIVDYLNAKANKNFKYTTQKTITLITALLKNYGPEDFKTVIDIKSKEWLHDPKNNKYLRPETLFNATKFESYINEASTPTPQQAYKRPIN